MIQVQVRFRRTESLNELLEALNRYRCQSAFGEVSLMLTYEPQYSLGSLPGSVTFSELVTHFE